MSSPMQLIIKTKQTKTLLVAQNLSSMVRGGRAQLRCRRGKPSMFPWAPDDMWVLDWIQQAGPLFSHLLRTRRQLTTDLSLPVRLLVR